VRAGDEDLAERFRRRALLAGVAGGGVAVGGLVVLHSDAHPLYDALVTGDGLPALVASVAAGVTTLVLVVLRRFEAARYSAAAAVAAIVVGWALAQSPELLPGLTVRQAAAPHDALVAVVVAVLAGAVILFPSLALLFRLTLAGRLDHASPDPSSTIRAAAELPPPRVPLRLRIAGALAIAGVGLMNLADADTLHVAGAACLLAFVVVVFRAALPAEVGGSQSA
jgi:cytochrome d ubiquinol oxidase subunit II